MQLRYSLGMILNPAELCPDIALNSPCGGGVWTCGTSIGNVTISMNNPGALITHTTIGTSSYHSAWFISDNNIFTAGKKYHIVIDIENTDIIIGGHEYFYFIEVFCGYNSTSKSRIVLGYHPASKFRYEFDIWAEVDSPIVVKVNAQQPSIFTIYTMQITYLSIKEYDWNTPLALEQSITPQITLENSETLENYKVDYIDNVIFFGAGDTWIKSQDLYTPILTKVEYYDGTNWNIFFIGNIYPKDINFEREICICSIENFADECININASKKINPFSLKYSWDGVDWIYNIFVWEGNYLLQAWTPVDYHDITSGLWSYTGFLFNSFCLIRDLIHECSDCFISFKSPLLETGGAFEGLGLTNGLLLADDVTDKLKFEISLADMIQYTNNILNIGFKPYKVGDVFYLYMDYKTNLRSLTTLTYNDVDNYKYTFAYQRLFSTIETGFTHNNDLDNNQETIYNSVDTVSDQVFNNVSNVLRNSYIIDLAINHLGTNTQLENQLFWLEYDLGTLQSLKTADPNTDQVPYAYNQNITEYQNMLRLASVLPLDYYLSTDISIVITGTETNLKYYEFEIPMNYTDLLLIMGNPFVNIILLTSGHNTNGYLEDFTYDLKLQMAKIKLLGL